MLQKTDKKNYIFFYLIIFLILSSIHNSNFNKNNFFIVKKVEVIGLDKSNNYLLEKRLVDLIGSNIFSVNKESFEFFSTMNLIKNFNVKKVYPNKIKVYLQSAEAVSIVKYLNELFILGNNGKILNFKDLPKNVPEVSGTNDIKKIFQTLKIIDKSNIDVENINKISFFPSGRINIELNNKTKIKFPINSKVEDLNFGLKLIESEKFNKSKILDLRIPNKVITYDK
tara:strand:- start:3842 stop:4519 length:678 start_codon:yes stop_codon:yes gene_type:complete